MEMNLAPFTLLPYIFGQKILALAHLPLSSVFVEFKLELFLVATPNVVTMLLL